MIIAADAQLIGWLKEKSTLKLRFCRFSEIWANGKALPAGTWLITPGILRKHAPKHTWRYNAGEWDLPHEEKHPEKSNMPLLWVASGWLKSYHFLLDADISRILEVSAASFLQFFCVCEWDIMCDQM